MRKFTQKVIIIEMIIVILMCLFPPVVKNATFDWNWDWSDIWNSSFHYAKNILHIFSGARTRGYEFIFSLDSDTKIDLNLLLLQIILAALIGMGIVILRKNIKPTRNKKNTMVGKNNKIDKNELKNG